MITENVIDNKNKMNDTDEEIIRQFIEALKNQRENKIRTQDCGRRVIDEKQKLFYAYNIHYEQPFRTYECKNVCIERKKKKNAK